MAYLHVWLWQTALSTSRLEGEAAASDHERLCHRRSQWGSSQHRSCPCAAVPSEEGFGKNPKKREEESNSNAVRCLHLSGLGNTECTYTFDIFWLVKLLFSVLQPGLQGCNCAAVLLPIRDHLFQHAANTSDLQRQVSPLGCSITEKFTNPFGFINWKKRHTFEFI